MVRSSLLFGLLLLVVSSAAAEDKHACSFDQDTKVLAYLLPEEDEGVLQATCQNAAMLHMEWRYEGAEGRYPRGLLTLHSPFVTLALEGPVQRRPDGRQTLTLNVNTHSALVRLIRRSDVEVRYPGGSYWMQADRTGCIAALLVACSFWRPSARRTHAELE